MNLFILRHASAGLRRANLLLDVRRPLDKEGKQHCLQLAHILNAMKVNFDMVVSSPLKRCVQTAQLVSTETGYEQRILLSNALAPEASFSEFQRLIRESSSSENVLVVGHNPNIQLFIGSLLMPHAGGVSAIVPAIRMRKGSLARVALDRGPAVLQSVLEPRLVRALYSTSIKSTKGSRRKVSKKKANP